MTPDARRSLAGTVPRFDAQHQRGVRKLSKSRPGAQLLLGPVGIRELLAASEPAVVVSARCWCRQLPFSMHDAAAEPAKR
jgi:hypothetical protein